MTGRLGPNQWLILSALAALEAKHGASDFIVEKVLDRVWHENFNLANECGGETELRSDLIRRAAGGEKDAAKALKISADSDLRVIVRHRAAKRQRVMRPWARALERMNPSRCFRSLEQNGLIERSRNGRSQVVRLTDEGRRVAARRIGPSA